MCLPDQIIEEEILVRLPVKSLKRFECVSKAWCGLIKNQSFIGLHLKHPSQKKTSTDYLILARTTGRDASADEPDNFLPFYSRDEDGRVVPVEAPHNFPPKFPASHDRLRVHRLFGPCNGIIGLTVRYGVGHGWEDAIYLCNPATGESRRLPDRNIDVAKIKDQCCYGTYACGLGFDPRTNEYKVVSALFYGKDDEYYRTPTRGIYRMGIYCLSSNTWREVDELDFPDIMRTGKDDDSDFCRALWDGNGLNMNGRLHWFLGLKTIMYFDISSEIMGQISCPNMYPKDLYCEHMCLLEDSLAFVVVSTKDEVTYSVAVWTMVDYGSWMKRFSSSFLPSYGLFPERVLCWTNAMLIIDRDCDVLSCVDLVEEDECQMSTFEVVDDFKDKYCSTVGAVVVRGQSLVSLR